MIGANTGGDGELEFLRFLQAFSGQVARMEAVGYIGLALQYQGATAPIRLGEFQPFLPKTNQLTV